MSNDGFPDNQTGMADAMDYASKLLAYGQTRCVSSIVMLGIEAESSPFVGLNVSPRLAAIMVAELLDMYDVDNELIVSVHDAIANHAAPKAGIEYDAAATLAIREFSTELEKLRRQDGKEE